ncbi:MAG: hypothetical protein ACE5FS_03480 [Paracoccaceae bacterium]
MTDPHPIDRIADAVMRGVIRTGAIRNTGGPNDNVAAAVAIMREEIKSFVAGPDYAGARDAVLTGALHEGYVLGLVIARCVARLTT